MRNMVNAIGYQAIKEKLKLKKQKSNIIRDSELIFD